MCAQYIGAYVYMNQEALKAAFKWMPKMAD